MATINKQINKLRYIANVSKDTEKRGTAFADDGNSNHGKQQFPQKKLKIEWSSCTIPRHTHKRS